jgi:hypothetical protein
MSTTASNFPHGNTPSERDSELARESSRRLARLLGKRQKSVQIRVRAENQTEEVVSIPAPAFWGPRSARWGRETQ